MFLSLSARIGMANVISFFKLNLSNFLLENAYNYQFPMSLLLVYFRKVKMALLASLVKQCCYIFLERYLVPVQSYS